ncbi:MAG: SDR family oxidoreductase [Planctomycetaceae bacterium]|nr:SDR family oxidoreductase [Planctomycetaceae bacterium]
MDLDLNGHIAAITGGAAGIGRACAAAFLKEGAVVALWDRDESVAVVAEELCRGTSGRAVGIVVDITSENAVADAVQSTAAQLGPIDHLVHAAAIGSGKYGFPFTNLSPQDWPRVLDVNIQGMVHVAHAVSPAMIERRSGTQVYIASVAGQIGSQTDPPYSAAKAANINFAQCLAKDLAPHGVRVNTVCPGMVETRLNESVWRAWHDQQPPELRRSYPEWAGDKIQRIVPLGRWQAPADIADMVVFLSSARAHQVTGQTINVDGGFVMHW